MTKISISPFSKKRERASSRSTLRYWIERENNELPNNQLLAGDNDSDGNHDGVSVNHHDVDGIGDCRAQSAASAAAASLE